MFAPVAAAPSVRALASIALVPAPAQRTKTLIGLSVVTLTAGFSSTTFSAAAFTGVALSAAVSCAAISASSSRSDAS